MRCNIEGQGQSIRVIGGVIVSALGVMLLIGAGVGALDGWAWFVGAGTLIVGGFMIFEGWTGWCVLRAMGIKTRM